MKKAIIGAILGAIWAYAVLGFALNNLKESNEQLKLEVDGYKLLLQQQELLLSETNRKEKITARALNQVLVMCVDGELIKISGSEYKCYLTYSM